MSATFLTGIARTTEPRTMLRRFLALDALVTGANAVVYLAASGPVGRLLGVDRGALLGIGAFLVVYAVGVGAVAARREPPALAVKAIIDANLGWVVLSLVSLALWWEPSTVGTVWIPLQAAVVAAFAVVQWGALRAGAAAR
jgi:hypothetical protein